MAELHLTRNNQHSAMNKKQILQHIIASLGTDLDVLSRAAKTAHEAATHEECVADNKYDTLGLEASYVAQGQANRAQEIKQAMEAYRKLELRTFAGDAAVRLTALVTLEAEDGSTRTVLLGPEAGGLKIEEDGEEIIVITPGSPLGRALLGKCAGDRVELPAGSAERAYEIVDVR
jgi:transcription elongation GreA/GreB family factor